MCVLYCRVYCSSQQSKSKSRSSIFSVIHPALHAAFAERNFEKPIPPVEPLTKVEYQSSPLRGTETRDRNAVGLPPTAQIPRATADSHEHIASTSFASAHVERGDTPTAKRNGAYGPVLTDGENSYASVIATYLSPSPAKAYAPIAAISPPLPPDDGLTRFGNPVTAPNPEATPAGDYNREKSFSRKAALDAVESAWRRMVSGFRYTLDSVLSPPTPSPDPFEQQVNRVAKNSGSYIYTQQDIDNLVSDIMHQIQLHQGEVLAHQDMLKNTGHWDPHDLSPRERDMGVTPPMLVMRTSVLVSPDVLADAVTTSTKKLLLSKANKMTWSVASRMLVDIHSRLADMFEPVNTVSSLPTSTSAVSNAANFSTKVSATSAANTTANKIRTTYAAGREHSPHRTEGVSIKAASRVKSPIPAEWAKIDPADFTDLSGRDSYVGHTASVSSTRSRLPTNAL